MGRQALYSAYRLHFGHFGSSGLNRMRALALFGLVAWLTATGLAGALLLRQGRFPFVALGTIATSLVAGTLSLLIVAGTVEFFGDSFHESSFWLKADVVLLAANLALGHAAVLLALGKGGKLGNALRVLSLCSVAAGALVVAHAAVTDRFSGDPGFAWVPAGFVGAGAIGTVIAWLDGRRKGQPRRETPAD